jgi:hypothetical protein
MSRVLRIVLTLVALCSGALPLSAAENRPLARGTAITDPAALREFDQHDLLTIARLLGRGRSVDLPLTTASLFASLPQLAQIRPAIDAELARYVARHKSSAPDQTIGVGEGFDVQLFDRALLDAGDTRFVLAGIVNRMDRAYVSEASCGEIRLIYRLTRFETAPDGNNTATRLPMTFNLVLKALDDHALARTGKQVDCAEIARRWLANDRPVELIESDPFPNDVLLDRVETNIQIAFAPKSTAHDFRTDYLLKVFKYNAATRLFEEAPLENQIDRDRILADEALGRELRDWLLAPDHLGELDRGTVLIPEKFLAKAALTPTPAGLAPSPLQPEHGLMEGEGGTPVFTDRDVVSALQAAVARGIAMQNIRSVAGFQRRLNDITCAGCHQIRSIGGFHFPGVDWSSEKPSTMVPASPHFLGDQVRRRDILTAFADGRTPDFSRGFSDRPQLRGSQELAGSQYQDGWGAHCYSQGSGSGAADESFSSWSCAKGLACQTVSASSRIGMCFVKTR